MGLSTHILDTALGKPVSGVHLSLSRRTEANWHVEGKGVTDADGRCTTLLGGQPLQVATYCLHFETATYFNRRGLTSLYPYVEIVFTVVDAEQHLHIPLLIAAHGYTTYRGS